jgi:hypothetical protein
MRSAWPTLEHVFSVRVGSSAQGAAAVSEPGLVFSGSRYPLGLFKANPVDLLAIERGTLVKRRRRASKTACCGLVSNVHPR